MLTRSRCGQVSGGESENESVQPCTCHEPHWSLSRSWLHNYAIHGQWESPHLSQEREKEPRLLDTDEDEVTSHLVTLYFASVGSGSYVLPDSQWDGIPDC